MEIKYKVVWAGSKKDLDLQMASIYQGWQIVTSQTTSNGIRVTIKK